MRVKKIDLAPLRAQKTNWKLGFFRLACFLSVFCSGFFWGWVLRGGQ